MSPTARSLAECRRRNWTAQVVEHYNFYTKRKHDLFGVIDIVACTPNGILGIQATSGDNHAARVAKSLAEPRLFKWFESGGRFEIWSFAKRGGRGKRKLWALRIDSVTVERLEAASRTATGGFGRSEPIASGEVSI